MNRETLRELAPEIAGIVAWGAVMGGVLAGPTRDWADNDLAYERQAIARIHEASKGTAAEATHSLVRYEQQLGEVCMKMFQQYLEGGKVADTPEDSVVGDIESADSDACGATRTEIRVNYHQLRELQAQAQEAATTQEYELSRGVSDQEIKWNIISGAKWMIGVVGGISAGIISGFFAATGVENLQNKRKARKTV
jgi:hypothetical protein